MNSRGHKRRIYARYRRRGRHWLTAEDRAWSNVVPIGREFGSKDFERLSILDAFAQGRIDGQKAMSLLGIDREALAAMVEKDGLWSQDLEAGWGDGDLLFTHAQCQGAIVTWPDLTNDSDDDLDLTIPTYPDLPVLPDVLPPARGFKESDSSMKNQLQLLRERFPYMFAGQNLGIDIPPGWMPGFQVLCAKIDELLGEDKKGFFWRQCKEKFGSARWYWKMKGRPAEIRIDLISETGVLETRFKRKEPELDVSESISALIRAAEAHTEHACIVCGEPGAMHNQGGYILVLCKEHARQRDDGTLLNFWTDELP